MLASVAQTLIAAGLGALLANFFAELVKGFVRRSQLHEAVRDDDLATMLSLVEQLDSLATDYWSHSGAELAERETLLRAKIVSRQQHLLALIADLFNGEPKRDCDVVITRLLNAVGGDSFGEPDRPAQPERLTAVYLECLAFTRIAKKSRRSLKRAFLA